MADRPSRSTGGSTAPKAGRPTCTRLCTSGSTVGRSTERSTGYESNALCIFGSTVRSTGSSNGRIFDRWRSTGRSTGRSDRTPTVIFFWRIYWRVLSLFCNKIFRADFSPFSGFKNKFLKKFKVPKRSILIVLSVLLFSKKIGFWEIGLLFFTSISIWYFPKSFSLIKTLSFSHLSYIFYPNLLGSLFCGKRKEVCG